MFTVEKNTTYTPVPDGFSTGSNTEYRESEELFFNGGFSTSPRQKRSLKSIILTVTGALLFLIPYTLITVKITSNFWKKERLHGASVIDCTFLH